MATSGDEERPQGGADFEFDLATPLFKQIQECMDQVEAVPLTEDNIAKISNRPGVYQLLWEGVPVYIGKADDFVPDRLRRHRFTLSGRRNIHVNDITFKSVCFAHTWDPFKPEDHLIRHYKTAEGNGWNGKGFGANEPGQNRGGTRLAANNFFKRFPLQSQWVCDWIKPGTYNALELLRGIKEGVPFWFKFQGNRLSASDEDPEAARAARDILERASVIVPRSGLSARDLLVLVATALPGKWQATITPSHMLLYMESDGVYPEMEVVFRTP